MKKPYIFATIFLFLVIFFSLNKSQPIFSASLFAEDSILNKNNSSENFSDTEKILKPRLINQEDIDIEAFSYLVLDQETFSPILKKNANQRLYVGSLTKLMTAVVALENGSLDDVVNIDFDLKSTPSYKMGLLKGEKITLENLLYGLLISSSNDAAEVVAVNVGGGYLNFINMMNNKAKEIGMNNTHFSNAMGIDNEENYSTAQDLAYLANYALGNDFVDRVIKIKEKEVRSLDGETTHYLENTNKLLFENDLNILGMKTGKTPQAGECLISLAENSNGNRILVIVLGSRLRFEDSKKLILWTWNNIVWE